MYIKSLHFNWFWLYRLVWVAVVIAIYWQYTFTVRYRKYSPFQNAAVSVIQSSGERDKRHVLTVLLLYQHYVEYMNIITSAADFTHKWNTDLVNKEIGDIHPSRSSYFQYMLGVVDDDYGGFKTKIDSVSKMEINFEVLDLEEAKSFCKIYNEFAMRHLIGWCGSQMGTDCGAYYTYIPLLIPERRVLNLHEKTGLDMVVASSFGYRFSATEAKYVSIADTLKMDTIFSLHGKFPVVFKTDDPYLRNQSNTHHTDTLYLEVSPEK